MKLRGEPSAGPARGGQGGPGRGHHGDAFQVVLDTGLFLFVVFVVLAQVHFSCIFQESNIFFEASIEVGVPIDFTRPTMSFETQFKARERGL